MREECYTRREIGRQKTMRICTIFNYNARAESVFRRVSLTLWRKGREFCLREENEFFSRRDVRTRSKVYSQKVKLPKVNVIREMEREKARDGE